MRTRTTQEKRLNRALVIGVEQINRGEVVEFDVEELLDELDEELGYSKA